MLSMIFTVIWAQHTDILGDIQGKGAKKDSCLVGFLANRFPN